MYTGQLVKNNTTYTCYIITSFYLGIYNPKSRSPRSPEGLFRAPKVRSSEGLFRVPKV